MIKHSQKKTKASSTVKTGSYAIALIKTKTLQFFVGLGVFTLLIFGGGITAVNSSKRIFSPPTENKTATPSPVKTNSKPQYYILKEGESLSDVASKAYGNPNMYQKLIDLNNLIDPDYVGAGTRLRIK